MKGFKNLTRTVYRHTPWNGGSVSRVARFAEGGPVKGVLDKIDTDPGHPEVTEHESDMHGHSAVQRKIASTEELAEHGGRGELTAGYAKGGKPGKHFHVHNHYHNGKRLPSKSRLKKLEKRATGGTEDKMAKGGRKPLKLHLKKGALHKELGVAEGKKIPKAKIEKAARSSNETLRKRARFAENASHWDHRKAAGGHICDDTHPIPPDYATGGIIDKYQAGGDVYATGGTINHLAGGGMPLGVGAPGGALGTLAAQGRPMPTPMRRPVQVPMPMRRPMPVAAGAPPTMAPAGRPMPTSGGGVRPMLLRAAGGPVSPAEARSIARGAVGQHVGAPAPAGHAGLGRMLNRSR